MAVDVVLVHPPFARACEPPPGLLVLAGHLNRNGVRTAVLDANLAVQEQLLSNSTLERAARDLEQGDAPSAHRTSARRAARRMAATLHALRDAQTYQGRTAYTRATGILAEGFRTLSRTREFRLTPSDFQHRHLSSLVPEDLLRAAREPRALGLIAEVDAAATQILRHDPAVIGASAVYLSQALPAFALAGTLRRRGYRGRLVLGGGLVGSWASRLGPDSVLFRVWDVLVTGPGEEALAALSRNDSLAGLPGVLSPELEIWEPRPGPRQAHLCFDPDPEGWPWARYWVPQPVLPLAASRGCYWRNCAFCPEAAQDEQPFRRARPEALCQAILRARDHHGLRWVHLTDNAVPPASLRRLAVGLRDAEVGWYGFVRLERQLKDPAFAEDLARGGCAMLQLGVETSSQRLLDLLGKGTRAEDLGPILRNLAGAGIRTYVYLLFGVPSESREEAEGTLRWAVDHADAVTFLNLSVMNLPRGSPLERRPDAFGLATLPAETAVPALSLYTGFGPGDPLGRRAARDTLAIFRAEPALREILLRTPAGFGANHAAFAPVA